MKAPHCVWTSCEAFRPIFTIIEATAFSVSSQTLYIIAHTLTVLKLNVQVRCSGSEIDLCLEFFDSNVGRVMGNS
jgi:hypothetical protein